MYLSSMSHIAHAPVLPKQMAAGGRVFSEEGPGLVAHGSIHQHHPLWKC